MASRPYDIVVFGATGFTGALTAEYLANHAPPETRWALAGRNMSKLEQVRSRLGSAAAELPLLRADVTDLDSVRAVAEASRVVTTTVGPYIRYGEPLVAACAAAGTDYVDLTGEPEFVDRMWLGYHEQAARSGARIVHSCGFDSIPYDLGALFTVEQLPEGVPIALEGFVRVGGTFSGGTYQSTIEILSRLRQGARWRAIAAGARPGHPIGACVGCQVRPTTTSSAAAGSSQSRRSTHRPSFAPPGRSIATAPILPTATTWRSSDCPCWSGWPAAPPA